MRIYEIKENPLKGNFDFEYLKSIHKYLFQDVYSWAGDIRNCNITEPDLFCLTEHIETYGNDIFNKLKKEKYFINYDFDKTLDKLVELFADINTLHPFRKGNDISQRLYIESPAKINGINLDLKNVSKKDMIVASHESINGNYDKLRDIFKNNYIILSIEERLKYINIFCSTNLNKLIISD